MTPAAWRVEPYSLRTAAKAATQGMYSRVKVRKEKADKGVNNCPSRVVRPASSPAPTRMARVLTTASLAVRPVIRAVEAIQLPKPRGANRGATKPPMAASILSELSATMLSRVSRVWRNQMMMVARKMMVKAL